MLSLVLYVRSLRSLTPDRGRKAPPSRRPPRSGVSRPLGRIRHTLVELGGWTRLQRDKLDLRFGTGVVIGVRGRTVGAPAIEPEQPNYSDRPARPNTNRDWSGLDTPGSNPADHASDGWPASRRTGT